MFFFSLNFFSFSLFSRFFSSVSFFSFFPIYFFLFVFPPFFFSQLNVFSFHSSRFPYSELSANHMLRFERWAGLNVQRSGPDRRTGTCDGQAAKLPECPMSEPPGSARRRELQSCQTQVDTVYPQQGFSHISVKSKLVEG